MRVRSLSPVSASHLYPVTDRLCLLALRTLGPRPGSFALDLLSRQIANYLTGVPPTLLRVSRTASSRPRSLAVSRESATGPSFAANHQR